MSLPPDNVIDRIIFYVSHPLAYIFKPLIICSEFGIIFNANRKSYWDRNSGNPTIEEGTENYVYQQVWKHTCEV